MQDAIRKILERVYHKSEEFSKSIESKPLKKKVTKHEFDLIKKDKIANEEKNKKYIIYLVYFLLVLVFVTLTLLLI